MTDRAKLYSLAVTITFGALAATWVTGCTVPPDGQSKDSRVTPTYGADGRLTQITFDRDGNGAVDTWGYMDGPRVVRVEVDENGDGTVDRWEYHRAPAGCVGADCGAATPATAEAPDKTIERIERATRRDGHVSRTEYFEQGLLVRAEEDTNGDEKIDKWETYANGVLAMVALDTAHDGRANRRLIYGADGSFLRLEADRDGTGVFTPLGQ